MNACIECGNQNHSSLVIYTKTTFGHGDSTHECFVKCENCGHSSQKETDWGIFEHKTFRKAQDNWNKESSKELI